MAQVTDRVDETEMTGPVLSTMVLTWRDGTAPAQVAAVTRVLELLRQDTPGTQRFEFGPDLGISPISRDYVVSILFDDVDRWRSYLASERHQEFRGLSSSLASDVAVVQSGVA